MLHTGNEQTVLTAVELDLLRVNALQVVTAHMVNTFEDCWPILCHIHDERFKSDVQSLVAPALSR